VFLNILDFDVLYISDGKNSYDYTESFVCKADLDVKLLFKNMIEFSAEKKLVFGIVISSLRIVVFFIDLFKAKVGIVL